MPHKQPFQQSSLERKSDTAITVALFFSSGNVAVSPDGAAGQKRDPVYE